MLSLGFFRSWRHITSLIILFLVGGVIVPVSTWWYVPSALWLFFRFLTRSLSATWVLIGAVLLSFQMAVLWSLPVGLLLIITILLLWSLENIATVRQRSIRWLLEILHGFLVTAVVLGLSQSMSVGRLLINCLIVLTVMAGVIVLGQWHET